MDHSASSPRSVPWKLTAATVTGNTIEFYDFTVYGTLTALVFNQLFFPEADPAVGTLLAFATFAVGFLSRPLGGAVFGHLGDRFGRKPMLMWSLGVMGAATFLMGLLPTYATAGVWAPILLTVLRFCQGFGIGGEWGGAVSLMVENAPPRRRGWYGSLVQSGSALGIILSALTVTILLATLSTDQLLSWGWRIPFLLSAVLVIVGMIIRLKIAESPEFRTVKAEGRAVDVPIIAVLKHHLRPVLLVTGGFLGFGAFSIIVMAYLVNYSTNQAGIDPTVMLSFTLLSFVLQIPTILFFGHLSDRVDRRRLMAVGSVLAMVSIFGMFWAVESHNPWLIMLGYAVGFGCLYPVAYGAQPALFADAFTPEVRFTGMSLGYQGANVLGSGFTPMIAASLLQYTGSPWAIPVFVTLTLVISMLCLMRLATLAAQRKALTSATSRDPQAGAVPSIV